jgi:AmmeMemoRadiSam system protein B/AmmeMemoRadiSam system protein A
MKHSTIALLLGTLVLAGCGGEKKPAASAAGKSPPAKSPAAAKWDLARSPVVPKGALVRRPAWSGKFYPGVAADLRADVTGRLKKAPRPGKFAGRLRALIVPHAGYFYSGDTAAAAYAALEGKSFERVVLLGPSHRHKLEGVSVSGADYYRTPLGHVAVDAEFAGKLREKAGASFVPAAHAREHSLEVQLPFLQTVIGPGVRVIPVLVGPSESAQIKLAGALKALLDARTVVVVSTDLSHYPSEDVARKVDAATVDSWKSLSVEKVGAVEREQMKAGHAGLACTMCGGHGVRTLLRLAPMIGIDEARTLKMETSASSGRDRRRVVGYAAVAFLAGAKPRAALLEPPELSAEARRRLLVIAREAAIARTSGKSLPLLDWRSLPAELKRKGGAFVTLRNGEKLRGCIGRFAGSDSLAGVVQQMGAAVTRDDRFRRNPVTAAEMAEITVKLSVLSPMRRVEDWRQVTVGVHGVMVRRGWRRGVLLPQVATEQGWSRERFLSYVCRGKARLAADAYKDPGTEVYVFTALVFGEPQKE